MYLYVRFAISLGIVACGELRADDQLPSIESLLRDWSTASRDCRSFDAKLTVYEYDVFNRCPKPIEGRFRHEAGGNFRYRREQGVDVARSDGSLLLLNYSNKSYRCFDLKQVAEQATLNQPPPIFHWLEYIQRSYTTALRRTVEHGPIPFLLLSDTEVLTSQYTLELHRDQDALILKAVAKDADAGIFQEVSFAFADRSRLPFAVRHVISPHYAVTHVLSEICLDDTPPDRDAFMRPDLTSFREQRLEK